MGVHYKVTKVSDVDGVVEILLAFGMAAQNPEIVRDAVAAVRALDLHGGKLLKINGPASLPVAVALAHEVAHRFGAVAVFDPKISPPYIVCITHDPDFALGQQIP